MRKRSAKSNSKKDLRHGSDAPQGRITRIDDSFPSPEELFKNDEKVKITIEIDGKTLDFFRKHADKSGGKYQRLIREVLRQYAQKYSA